MNISASMYPIIPLLRYRYIISVIRRQRREGLGSCEEKGARARAFTPFSFSNGWRKKKLIRARGWRRVGERVPYTRAFSGRTIDFGIRWQFFKPMANNYRILPPSSGFRHKRPSPFAIHHRKTGDTWIPFYGTSLRENALRNIFSGMITRSSFDPLP